MGGSGGPEKVVNFTLLKPLGGPGRCEVTQELNLEDGSRGGRNVLRKSLVVK